MDCIVSDELRKRIEEDLRNWHNVDSVARMRFEAAQGKWDKALQPLEDAIVASETLTAADFAVTINVRCQ